MSAAVDHVDIPVAGGNLRASVSGSGPAALLLHGGPGLGASYCDGLARELEQHFRCWLVQQRGVPPSLTTGPFHLQQLLRDLSETLDRLGSEQVWLVGHSSGGLLAQHLAAARPDQIAGLVLVGSCGGTTRSGVESFERRLASRLAPEQQAQVEQALSGDEPGSWNEAFGVLWPAYFADPSGAPSAPASLQLAQEAHVAGQRSLLEAYDDGSTARALSSIVAPTLFVHGADDPMPLEAVQESAAHIADAMVEVIQDCGHFPWIECPGATATAVARWRTASH